MSDEFVNVNGFSFETILTSILGIVGIVSGVWWHLVRLKLIPFTVNVDDPLERKDEKKLSNLDGNEKSNWRLKALPAWHIANRRNFSIHIQRLGFALSKFSKDTDKIWLTSAPILLDGPERLKERKSQYITFPLELRGRESVLLMAQDDELAQCAREKGYRYMFVSTSDSHFCSVTAPVTIGLFTHKEDDGVIDGGVITSSRKQNAIETFEKTE